MSKEGSIKRLIPALTLFLYSLWSSPPGVGGQNKYAERDLAVILKKTADYCRKLEASVLDFVCREDVEETIDPSRESTKSLAPRPDWNWKLGLIGKGTSSSSHIPKSNNHYVYDYQCVRSNRILKEKRTLLEINGKKRNDPVAGLQTAGVSYRNPLLSPVNFFAENSQRGYNFRIAGMDRIKNKTVTVVEAVPEAGGGPEPLCLTGKAWIDPETAEILRMEWTQKPAERAEVFSQRERLINGNLRLTARAEFKTEKNGFRFPSMLTIEEAYLNARGRAFIRSVTNVDFKDFQFFSVEVDVRLR